MYEQDTFDLNMNLFVLHKWHWIWIKRDKLTQSNDDIIFSKSTFERLDCQSLFTWWQIAIYYVIFFACQSHYAKLLNDRSMGGHFILNYCDRIKCWRKYKLSTDQLSISIRFPHAAPCIIEFDAKNMRTSLPRIFFLFHSVISVVLISDHWPQTSWGLYQNIELL